MLYRTLPFHSCRLLRLSKVVCLARSYYHVFGVIILTSQSECFILGWTNEKERAGGHPPGATMQLSKNVCMVLFGMHTITKYDQLDVMSSQAISLNLLSSETTLDESYSIVYTHSIVKSSMTTASKSLCVESQKYFLAIWTRSTIFIQLYSKSCFIKDYTLYVVE